MKEDFLGIPVPGDNDERQACLKRLRTWRRTCDRTGVMVDPEGNPASAV